MGAHGTAVITDLQSAPAVRPGTGQVVTATFHHPPANQVLSVSFEGDDQPLGKYEPHAKTNGRCRLAGLVPGGVM